MSYRVGIFIVSLCLLVAGLSATAADYPGDAMAGDITTVQAAILNERFDRADSLAQTMIERYPHDPVGYLFRAAGMLSEMTAFEDNLYDTRFTSLIDTTIALAESVIDSTDGTQAAWMYLYLGNARAYRALWEARFGSFVSAIRNGFGARDAFEAGLAADSTVYDLYVGLGSYHYWKSARAGLFKFVGILSDDRDKGIHELQLAADSARLFADQARQALIWIWLDREQYDSALVASQEAFEKYPHGNLFLFPMARAQFELHKYRDAIATYKLIRDRIADEPGNYYNLIEVDYRLSRTYERVQELDRARTIARAVRDYVDQVPRRIQQLHRDALDYLHHMARI
ncbi:hypothetical protein GF420_11775 [candidate division GN15 bacterium]|nr:hypothetical protein [candidate division GN15 bacterium]